MTQFALHGDAKDWARKIMTKLDYGQKVSPYAAWCARSALGVPEPIPAHKRSVGIATAAQAEA
jgi:hypothetical protein